MTVTSCSCKKTVNRDQATCAIEQSESAPTVQQSEVSVLSLLPEQIYVESLIYFPVHDPRPYAKAIANGIVLNGLLDTGAHATVIGRDMYESICDWKTELQPIDSHIITADGTTHKCMGALLLKYELGNKRKIVPTVVVDMPLKRPIFGMDFQRCFDIGLHFNQTSSIELEAPKQTACTDNHELSTIEKEKLSHVIDKIPKVPETGELNCTTKIAHKIDTGIAKPVYVKPYIFSPNYKREFVPKFSVSLRGV